MANVSFADVGVLFLIVVTASLAYGSSSGKDVSQRRAFETAEQSPFTPDRVDDLHHVAASRAGARRRAKRCTCYTYKDKECVYYCHLDIIWITTPEHTVPYGMSSYQGSLRTRRSAGTEQQRRGAEGQRCVCTLQTDSHCSSFCRDSRQKNPQLATLKTDESTAALGGGPTMK